MSSPDQLVVSPDKMETAAAQLAGDAAEATATAELLSEVGTGFSAPGPGLSVAAALGLFGSALSSGFGIVAQELTDLSTHVDSAARLSVLVDNNAAGYFTASDAI
jgi:hypothetical protein